MGGRESPASDPEILNLVKRLIAAVRKVHVQASPREGDATFLLDVEVEGIRCVLMRFSSAEYSRRHSISPTPPTARVSIDTPAALGGIRLSPREREIVRMVACGYPNKAIAAVLDISAWTVSTHVRRVFAKLSVNSRAAMVAILISEGELRQAGTSFPAAP